MRESGSVISLNGILDISHLVKIGAPCPECGSLLPSKVRLFTCTKGVSFQVSCFTERSYMVQYVVAYTQITIESKYSTRSALVLLELPAYSPLSPWKLRYRTLYVYTHFRRSFVRKYYVFNQWLCIQCSFRFSNTLNTHTLFYSNKSKRCNFSFRMIFLFVPFSFIRCQDK